MVILPLFKSDSFNRVFIPSLTLALFLCSSPLAEELALQTPMTYSDQQNIAGWVMSEKLDGIRGYWDGSRMVTRKGLPLNPPPWFINNFPPFPLDGELWSKRGDFEFIQSVVLDKTPGEGWKQITYNIFEVPSEEGAFYSRLDRARTWFDTHENPHVRIIPQILIKEKSDMLLFLKEIESLGGEGLILKDPNIAHHTGRSPHILKVKKCQDMEGVVVDINKGKGKYKDVMGSLSIRLDNGITFKLGTGFSDKNRRDPPQIGSTVTFKHYGFTKNGIPKFASFLRERRD